MTEESVISIYEDIKSSGYNLESIVSGDTIPPQKVKEKVEKLISLDPNFFSNLLSHLISEEFDELTAKKLWFEIIEHKYMISEKLGRNVGIRVATLDYLENIKGIIKSPKIIEEDEFIKTVDSATKDALTGLYNRKYLLDNLKQKIRSNRKFCVAFLDLDGFKKYNDTQGHQAGDLILQEFALALHLKFDLDSNFVARYGGDEFMVYLDNISKVDAKILMNKFREEIYNQFSSVNITVSIGLVEYPCDAVDLGEIVAKVDELLYRVKEFGGNKVFVFTEMVFNYVPKEDYKPKEVSIVGDFNNWDRKLGIMNFDKEKNLWQKNILLKPGNYRYKFLIDKNFWDIDKNSSMLSEDGFGGKCSVINVYEK